MQRQVNYIEKKDQEEHIVLLAHKGESEEKNTWYLNTRANNHMCSSKIYLWSLINWKLIT